MRILYLTRQDIKGNLALNHFLHQISLAEHQVAVILSDKIFAEETVVKDLVHYEFLEFHLPATYFQALEAFAPRGIDDQPNYTFRQIAQRFEIPVQLHGNINVPETVQWIQAWQPDLMISCRYSHIMKRAVLVIPTIGALNVHPGELPEYRGLLAPYHGLKNRAAQLGVTVHWIDEGVDTGDILEIGYLPYDPRISVLDYYIALYLRGIDGILALLPQLVRGEKPVGRPQGPGNYYRYPTPAELAQFEQDGFKLYDLQTYLAHLAQYYTVKVNSAM